MSIESVDLDVVRKKFVCRERAENDDDDDGGVVADWGDLNGVEVDVGDSGGKCRGCR